jgi:hypothetical protein
MNELDNKHIIDGITIDKTKEGYRVFTIPTQHFNIVDLDELTNDRFDLEIKRQEKYEKDSSELIYISMKMNNMDNKNIEVSLPGDELSDIENLTYLFEKYKFTVERGKPNLRAANRLKKYIDIIQVKELTNE